MRNSHRWSFASFATLVAATLPGCLSLGGKTVYTSETPQTSDRLSALERRVSILEQAVGGKPAPPVPPSLPSEH
jgi:hypothetical protein